MKIKFHFSYTTSQKTELEHTGFVICPNTTRYIKLSSQLFVELVSLDMTTSHSPAT